MTSAVLDRTEVRSLFDIQRGLTKRSALNICGTVSIEIFMVLSLIAVSLHHKKSKSYYLVGWSYHICDNT